ncbi:hypothetical protein DAEQUDRAFT_100093 [Daedalea quercina L-15889]|uniref:Methyltransferase domain-containing protein n=1 Tax=Daedalea quercina L-15889 TaxID=1314783 RepID=A0A165KX33_9APHY|nr:hypothetical protein DAEQUDRAFT_100093 [Daedalea quercina L-15889]
MMAPPRRLLCQLFCASVFLASVALLSRYSVHGLAIRSIHSTQRRKTTEQLVYMAEKRYGETIAMRHELAQQRGLYKSVMPNISTISQLFPPTFSCPYPPALVGASWICGLGRLAETEQCSVYSIAPMNDTFATRMAKAVPTCSTTAYTPGPEGFGSGRVYMTTSVRGYARGRGWVGLGPVTPTASENPRLVQQRRDVGYDALRDPHNYTYTLGRLLGSDRHSRVTNVLRIDLPFSEMTRALASLPVPLLSKEDDAPWVLPVEQLVLVLRLGQGEAEVPEGFPSFCDWWESLERVGLRPFAVGVREDNMLEYSFFNIRALHSFAHSS